MCHRKKRVCHKRKGGRLLVWDATCLDTFATYHLLIATREAGTVAALAERSNQKYAALDQCHNFTLVAVKTAGPFGPETFSFLRELGYIYIAITPHRPLPHVQVQYLHQWLDEKPPRVQVALQRVNHHVCKWTVCTS